MSEEQRTAETVATAAAPDASAVNDAWAAEPPRRRRARWLAALWERLLLPRFEAQRRFNAAQVRLDNELLSHLAERFAATHAHYDRILGQLGRRQDELDLRHRQLEQELVRHVRDLVTRIDVVLGEANRDRQALLFALGETRERLSRLEETLRRG